jgi:hypothetical protein
MPNAVLINLLYPSTSLGSFALVHLLICKEDVLKLTFSGSVDKEDDPDQFLKVGEKLSIHSKKLTERSRE